MNSAKNVLKSLVKECLVEILSEGIGNSSQISEQKIIRDKKKSQIHQQKIKNTILEKKQKNNNMENIISSIADNDLMKSILSDTANTTLVEQLNHEKSNHKMNGSEIQQNFSLNEGPGVDIDSIISENKNNWNLMAFGNVKK
jgi:isochorismate synthase EntC